MLVTTLLIVDIVIYLITLFSVLEKPRKNNYGTIYAMSVLVFSHAVALAIVLNS